jgi:hypothetical protein
MPVSCAIAAADELEFTSFRKQLVHAVMDKGPAAYVVTAPLPSCYVFECSWAKGRMRGAFPIDLTGWLWSQLFRQIW